MAQGVCTGDPILLNLYWTNRRFTHWALSPAWSGPQTSALTELFPLYRVARVLSFLPVLAAALQLICAALSPDFIVRPEIPGPCVPHP